MLASTQVSDELKQRIESFLESQNIDSEATKLVKVEADTTTFFTIHTSKQEITLYEYENHGLRVCSIEELEIPIDLHEEETDDWDDELNIDWAIAKIESEHLRDVTVLSIINTLAVEGIVIDNQVIRDHLDNRKK